ncbi:glycosyltransferase family 2 protein [Ferruginibacter sp. SUN002]|uniref:glycosyltransferase family 2 protein n=1 Tax=Ferruginibacter sp. SUN002 TaxID=2937789 RepID=UPI003D3677AD
MKTTPILSIITINYNNIDGLMKTVQSVFAQSFKNFEYIIIDGGSTDGSKEYIETIKEKLSYWVSEKDNGVYNAINKGIQKATGEYLMFMNGGDCLHDSTVLGDIFEKTSISEDVIYGDTLYLTADGTTVYKSCDEELSFEYLIKDDINHQSCFIKRSLFDKFGLYDERLKIAADHKFFIASIILGSATSKYVARCIAIYNLEGFSSKNEAMQYVERDQIHKEIIPPLVWALYEENQKLKQPAKKGFATRVINKIRRSLK